MSTPLPDFPLDTIVVSDAIDYLRTLPDASVQAICTDPPYGLHQDRWDKGIDVATLLREAERVITPSGFLAFTHMFPYELQWLNVLHGGESAFGYRDRVIWLKRNLGGTRHGLNTCYEVLYIYARSKEAHYHETRGRYSDVKMPGVAFDAVSVEGLQRTFDALVREVETGVKVVKRQRGRAHRVYVDTFAGSPGAWTATANFTNVWSFLPENQSRQQSNNSIVRTHATTKPVKLFERLIGLLSDKGDVICDPFMGSGTTAVAARNTGRHYIGCDTSPEFVELARARLSTEVGAAIDGNDYDESGEPSGNGYHHLPLFDDTIVVNEDDF